MRDGVIPPERICDPVGKRFPGLGRDPERTPMQWSDEPYAGFSRVEPWLPVAPGYEACNVRAQLASPNSLLQFYRTLIWKRKRSPALLAGSYRSLPSPAGVFLYERKHPEQCLWIALNFGDASATVEVPHAATVWFATTTDRDPGPGTRWHLGPSEGLVLEIVSAR